MKAFKVNPNDASVTTWHEVEFGEDHEHFANRRVRVMATDPQTAILIVESMTPEELEPMVPVRFSPTEIDLLLKIFPYPKTNVDKT